MRRPSRDDTLMAVAYTYEDRSTCSRAHVGAVIALDGRIIVSGYNGTPAGMAHCDHTCHCNSGGMHTSAKCGMVAPCKLAVHAEANAIAAAAKFGISTNGAELFVTVSPCYACAQLIINAGLTRVVYSRPYRDESGLHLLAEAGVKHIIHVGGMV